MPHRVNGIGTWYYGKRNSQQYQGVCRSCNRLTTLTSYDTRLFVSIFFIPTIPLQRKRIIEECASCRRHYPVPLEEWNRARRRADETIAAYRQSPGDTELAKEALRACVGFRNLDSFLNLSPEIEKGLARDAKTLCLLAAVHDSFGRIKDAERLLLAAIQLDNSDEISEALADNLLRQGRPDEAESYLRHVIEKGVPDRVDGLYQLAQGYQVKGEHEKALAAFMQCETINPLIAQDATFKRLRDLSAKHLGTHTVVKPGEIIRKDKQAAGVKRFSKVAAVVLILAALAYVILSAIEGARREIFVINGVSRPYTVRINGADHLLEPKVVNRMRVSEGDVKVQFVNGPVGTADETFSIRTPFLTRPFAKHTFIINPDAAAILERTHHIYSPVQTNNPGESPVSYIGGQTLHALDGIDYEFEAAPRSITTDSNSGPVTREGVSLPVIGKDVLMSRVLLALSKQLGKEATTRAVQGHVLFEPEQDEYLNLLSVTMNPQELASFLRPQLGKRPLQVHWHRTYQNAMDRAEQNDLAEKEYDEMLRRDPENKDLMYLAGRASHDIDKSVAMCLEASSDPSPSGYAIFALCGYHVCIGEFHEGVDYGAKALRLMPRQVEVRWYYKQALLAEGQFKLVSDMLAKELDGSLPETGNTFDDDLYVRSRMGEQVDVQSAIARLRSRAPHLNAKLFEQAAKRAQAQLDYCGGNTAAFIQALRPAPDAEDRFAADLSAGDLKSADEELKQMEPDAHQQLLCYLVASQKGQSDQADRYLKAATDVLSKGTFDDRSFASALDGHPSQPLDKLIRVRETPATKAILLASLGTRDPAARESCFAMARKLNYDTRFPHLLLQSVTDAKQVQ